MWNQWKAVLIVNLLAEALTVAAAVIAVCRGFPLACLFLPIVLPVILGIDLLFDSLRAKLQPTNPTVESILSSYYWAWGANRKQLEWYLSHQGAIHWACACVFSVIFGMICLAAALTTNPNPQ